MTAKHDHTLAVRCRAVTRGFGTGPSRVEALRGIDLDIYQGELLMLVGPSGCGKTTLVSIISGILPPEAGQCEVLGTDLARIPDDEKSRFRGCHIGFVFQQFNLFPALTALENVAIPLLTQDTPRVTAMARAHAALEAVSLATRAATLPGALSVGQQQRVAVARAIVHRPQLIVCDEPTSSLDHRAGQETMQLLRDIGQEGERTVLVVTHDNRIIGFADRIAQMDDGRISGVESNPSGELEP